MFHLSEQELERLGAKITSNEIKQQPMLWKETLEIYLKEKENIDQFLDQLRALGRVRVIFTGAGTSAYVGDTLLTYLKNKVDENHFSLESIPTTDIVSNPYDSYIKRMLQPYLSHSREVEIVQRVLQQ
nr:hypothetical protein [Heyndrickxia oleronia]